MVLKLPLQSPYIEATDTLPFTIEELIPQLDTSNDLSLIRAFALWQRVSDEPIKAFIQHDDAVLLINWIEEVNLTIYPPTVSPLPRSYIESTKAFNRLIHNSSHHQSHTYSFPHTSDEVTREARYLYRNGRHIILWTIVAPPGTENYVLARTTHEQHTDRTPPQFRLALDPRHEESARSST